MYDKMMGKSCPMDDEKKKVKMEMLKDLRRSMGEMPDEAAMVVDAKEVAPEKAEKLEEQVMDVADTAGDIAEEAMDEMPLEEKEGELVVKTDDPELIEEIKKLLRSKMEK